MAVRKTAIYFLASGIPTPEEQAEADKLQITAFRNSVYIPEDCALEQAEFVAGNPAILARYRKELPGVKILTLKSKQQPPDAKPFEAGEEK